MHAALYRTLLRVPNARSQRGIGWAIRKVRKGQNRTLEELAAEIGSDAANLSRVERGKQDPTEDGLVKVARALNVTPSQLWQLAEQADRGDEDSGTLLALSGLLSPEQRRQLVKYGRFLVDAEHE